MKRIRKKKKYDNKYRRSDIKYYFILFLMLITGVVLVYASYAWFSSTLNVQIYGFNVRTKHDDDLSISLNGQDWSHDVNISSSSIITDLTRTYPNHTNRWSDLMNTVSSVGMTNNSGTFSVFYNKKPINRNTKNTNNNFIHPKLADETAPDPNSEYFAFDIFILNNTTSPYNDNLYIRNEKELLVPETEDDEFILNSIRFGMLYIGTVKKTASLNEIQNINCQNGGCKQFIYEPNTTHTTGTIDFLKTKQISIDKDTIVPTYGVYTEGEKINLWSGVHNSKIPFNDRIFAFQNTITSLDQPIFELPSGISKFRIYLWVEGEDVDIIQYISPGYRLKFGINFEKDFAGQR